MKRNQRTRRVAWCSIFAVLAANGCMSRPWMSPPPATPLATQGAAPGGTGPSTTAAIPRTETNRPQPPSERQTPETKAVVPHGSAEAIADVKNPVPTTTSNGPSTESLYSMVAMLSDGSGPTPPPAQIPPPQAATHNPTVSEREPASDDILQFLDSKSAFPQEIPQASSIHSKTPRSPQKAKSSAEHDMVQFRDDVSDQVPVPPEELTALGNTPSQGQRPSKESSSKTATSARSGTDEDVANQGWTVVPKRSNPSKSKPLAGAEHHDGGDTMELVPLIEND